MGRVNSLTQLTGGKVRLGRVGEKRSTSEQNEMFKKRIKRKLIKDVLMRRMGFGFFSYIFYRETRGGTVV